MRLKAQLRKDGNHWLIESKELDLMTQGRTRKEAVIMLKDAVESLVNDEGFNINIEDVDQGDVFFSSNNVSILLALMLRRMREASDLTLSEVAKALGVNSPNAYGRYEQGRSTPSLDKLSELLRAINPAYDLVLEVR